jgi:uncharacterized protein (TIGR00730 family)
MTDTDDFESDGDATAPRRTELPWQHPKPASEDPEAPARVQALVASPVYREAENDPDFLALPEARAPRLALDYLKAEILLNAHDIHHTIVVFGSTRIPEPQTAQRQLDKLRAQCRDQPGDAELARDLAVAERRLVNSRYYTVARELGTLVGTADSRNPDGRIVIMTGGGPGIMEAANRGAFESGAETIGLNITLPHEQYPNPYITPELCFRFHYFALRKLHFLKRARALVAFPGGYGTLDELFETLTLVQTRKIAPLPVVLVGETYWRRLVDFDFLIDEGTIDPEDADLFVFAETAEAVWDHIVNWYAQRGTRLWR